ESAGVVAEGQVHVAGHPAAGVGVHDRGARVPGDQGGLQSIGQRLAADCCADQCPGAVVQVVPLGGGVGVAVLDRLPAATLGLDLQCALPGVQVGAGADLEPTAPAPGVGVVGEQLGGIEVHRLVVERAPALDVEPRQGAVQLPGAGQAGCGRYQ